jgi:hypothetical protein
VKRVHGAGESIRVEVSCWPGVTARPHRFGGTEFRLDRRELGHVHGDALVDIPFPRAVRDELVAAGRVEPHHILPESGWISFRIRREDDVAKAVDLFRRAYAIAIDRRAGRPEAPDTPAAARSG